MRSGRLKKLLWGLAALTFGVFALRAFFGDVYRITSDSMLPTLREGEYVFVRFVSSTPRRGDLVVLERDQRAVVKRAVALGGETVLVARSGDLFVDGELQRRGPGAPLVALFDSRVHAIDEHFEHGAGELDPWSFDGEVGTWELDARRIERGRSAGLLRFHPRVRDGYLDEQGERQGGAHHVGDTALEFEYRLAEPLPPGARFRAYLVEQADTFEVSFESPMSPEPVDDAAGRGAGGLVAVFHRRAGSVLEELGRVDLEVDFSTWTRVRFENVDDSLALLLDGEPVWSEAYERNTRHPKDTAGVGLSIGSRAGLGGEGCRAVVRELHVWRDFHYTQRGTYAIGKPLPLAPDEVFVLGDNSGSSRDSREWGPVAVERIRGRASWVVWPPGAIRPLGPHLR